MRSLAPLLALVTLVACQGSGAGVGSTCSRGSECQTGTCAFGRCRAGCSANRDCPSGASCLLDATGSGACGIDLDLGCESGVGRACSGGLVCVGDRCEQGCADASDCPADGECRAPSAGGAMFCFDARGASDAGPAGDAAPPDAEVDAGPGGCAIKSACFQRAGSACALDCLGRVWCWGQQHGGRLGNGHGEDVAVPTPGLVVDAGGTPLRDVDSLACGDGFSCVHVGAANADHAGHVLCWGYDEAGAFSTTTPLAATDLLRPIVGSAIALSASFAHACALDPSTGSVLCFGRNDGLIAPTMADDVLFGTPTAPAGGIARVAEIGVAAYGGCARLFDGRVVCWGENDHGQAGHVPIESMTGVTDPNVGPTTIETAAGMPLEGVSALAVGLTQRAVLQWPAGASAPVLLTWGGNEQTQLGDVAGAPGQPCEDLLGLGDVCRARPATPVGAPELSSIASEGSANLTCGVVAATSHVLCWGINFNGFAGVPGGGTSWLALRAEVQREGGAILDDVDHVFVGNSNACATRHDGTLWCWGPNQDAQLARPIDALEHRAVQIVFPFP